jgi:hypothetical protein
VMLPLTPRASTSRTTSTELLLFACPFWNSCLRARLLSVVCSFELIFGHKKKHASYVDDGYLYIRILTSLFGVKFRVIWYCRWRIEQSLFFC